MTESNSNTNSDLKDMQKILIDKSNIGTSNPVKNDNFVFQRYRLINPPQNAKRVLNNSTVRYFLQTYLYDEISQKFEQCEKNYKNIVRDKISDMKQQKKWIRYCLLLMQEEEQSIFEIDKDTLKEFYQNQVDALIKEKKRQKEKELKEIEKEKIREKNQKEIEELKKKGEYQEGVIPSNNPLPPKPKQEIVIDMDIVNNIPNKYKFDGKIYYRIYIEDVFIERPPFPDKAKDLTKYVKEFNQEIKRLLLKDAKKNTEKNKNNKNNQASLTLNMAETWCNEIINKIFNMGKGKVKETYESSRFANDRKNIEKEMKKPLLNLMLIYSKKMGNNSQMIGQAINLVENTYYKRYKGQFDESFLKITGRYIMCLIKINDFSKAEKTIEIIKKNCSQLPNYNSIITDLEPKLLEAKNKKNSENILVSKGKIKAGGNDSQMDYDWQQGLNEEELKETLKKDAELVKGNMELINSNL